MFQKLPSEDLLRKGGFCSYSLIDFKETERREFKYAAFVQKDAIPSIFTNTARSSPIICIQIISYYNYASREFYWEEWIDIKEFSASF